MEKLLEIEILFPSNLYGIYLYRDEKVRDMCLEMVENSWLTGTNGDMIKVSIYKFRSFSLFALV